MHVKNKVRQNKKDEWIIQISPDHGQFHTSLRSHRVLQTLERLGGNLLTHISITKFDSSMCFVEIRPD